MNINSVASATLVAVWYDETSETLQLEFRSHAVYRYFGVPGSVYAALLAAPSKGRYFNGAIRAHFPHFLVSKSDAGQRGES